jgi:hypothetical protein
MREHTAISMGSTDVSELPDIAFVPAYQQGHDVLGCAGSSAVHTPNLDNLTKERALLEGLSFLDSVPDPHESRDLLETPEWQRVASELSEYIHQALEAQ